MLECHPYLGACKVCLCCPKCDCNHDGVEPAIKLDRLPGRPVKNKASSSDSERETEGENEAKREKKDAKLPAPIDLACCVSQLGIRTLP